MKTKTSDQILSYGKQSIPYRLHISPRKRLRIVVTPALDVRIYAPDLRSKIDILAAIQTKAPWINRQLDAMKKFHPLPTPHKYISGETFIYLGRQYRLRVEQGSKTSAKLRGQFLYISVPNKSDSTAIRKQVDAWYHIHAKDRFQRYLAQCLKVAKRHGVQEPTVVIRRMRTRWGSCSTNGRITLNLNLIQTPVHCIEYVIMHELCHLKHHNHSKAFYRLLACCMPSWQRRKQLLQQIVITPC